MPLTPVSKRGRAFGAAALAVTISVTVVACSAPEVNDDAPVQNRATWAMPLDEFWVYSPELDNYAEQLQIADCLTAQGYDWPVPWQDTDYTQPEDFNRIGLRIFTPEIAQKWGYHLAPPANEESADLWVQFVQVTTSYFPNPELDAALLSCRDDVREKDEDPFATTDGTNFLSGLAIQAEQVALQDDEVIAATKKWRECLQSQVDYTVPVDPWSGMPSEGAMEKWGILSGGTPEASAEELAAAVADADCRETSGLAEAKYQKSWEQQLKLVQENRDELDRIRAAAAERQEKLLTIVAENTPPAP